MFISITPHYIKKVLKSQEISVEEYTTQLVLLPTEKNPLIYLYNPRIFLLTALLESLLAVPLAAKIFTITFKKVYICHLSVYCRFSQYEIC
jgi:hypothetical protein